MLIRLLYNCLLTFLSVLSQAGNHALLIFPYFKTLRRRKVVKCEEMGNSGAKDGPDFGLGNQGKDGLYIETPEVPVWREGGISGIIRTFR